MPHVRFSESIQGAGRSAHNRNRGKELEERWLPHVPTTWHRPLPWRCNDPRMRGHASRGATRIVITIGHGLDLHSPVGRPAVTRKTGHDRDSNRVTQAKPRQGP